VEEEGEACGLVIDACDEHLRGRFVAEERRSQICFRHRGLSGPGALVLRQLENERANEWNIARGCGRNAKPGRGFSLHRRIIRLAEWGVNAIFGDMIRREHRWEENCG
jgi:hypothetical protein